MVHIPLMVGDIIKVLECLHFSLIRISAKNNFYIYSLSNCSIEIPIPSEINVISIQWLKKIIRKIEDCGISHKDMVRCGLI